MKGFSGKEYNLEAGDKIIIPHFYGHENIEFIVTDYDIECGEIVRSTANGGRCINLDVCVIELKKCHEAMFAEEEQK